MIFGWEQREENSNIRRNTSTSDILTLLTLLSADAKSAVLLKVPFLIKVEVCNFILLHFPKWLCLIHGQLAISLRCVKWPVVYKCQCFCLYDIHQNTKGTTVLYIYNIFEDRPKALLKNRLALPIHPQGVIFQHIFKNAFIYRCFFNIDYR